MEADDNRRELIELLIEHVSVGKWIAGSWDALIEIHWNFQGGKSFAAYTGF